MVYLMNNKDARVGFTKFCCIVLGTEHFVPTKFV